jgi:hypothetical protein
VNWFLNLLSGWLPIGVNSTGEKKSFGEWAGKIVWVIGIVLALMFLDKTFNKPPTIHVEKGGTYQASEPRDTIGVGCNLWRLYIKGGMKSK